MPGKADRPAGDGKLRSLEAAIVESSTDAIISMTLDGIITSWNAGAVAIYGYQAEEVIGRSVLMLFPPDRFLELAPVLDQIRNGGPGAHYETKRVGKDGTLIDVSLSVSPVHDGHGTIAGVATVARNVTERRWAENERSAAEARRYRAERMEAISQLAGGIAQDFGGLLSTVLGYAAQAAEMADGDPRLRADVQKMQLAAARAARLASDLLVFSGREQARPEPVNLNAVLAGARGLLQASVGAGVELRLSTAPDLPPVLADRAHIEQMLVNLAVNARDAMFEGGTVTFATGRADPGEVADAQWPAGLTVQPGPCVELTVSDTGSGMDAETMDRAFEPYFTTKPPGQAAGLGLAVVYGIITRAGGRIAIESEEGMGTIVRIFLPAITA